MQFSTRNTGAALALAIMMSACSAEEPLGTVSASMGGTPYQGITLDAPVEGSASADFRVIGAMTMISIQGHDPGASSIMDNVLNLSISLMGADASATQVDATISYWPEGMTEAFYTSEESGVDVDIGWDILALGDSPFAQGSFSANLCRKGSYFTETDTSDCMAVEGTFETVLRRSEI